MISKIHTNSGLSLGPDNPCFHPEEHTSIFDPYFINTTSERACLSAARGNTSVIDAIKQFFNPSDIPDAHNVIKPGTPTTPVGYDSITGNVDPGNTQGKTGTIPFSTDWPNSPSDNIIGSGSFLNNSMLLWLGVGVAGIMLANTLIPKR